MSVEKRPTRPGSAPHHALVGRSDAGWLAAIVVAALALRLVWAAFASADPADGRFDDSVFYHFVAASLEEGKGYSSPYTSLATAQWPPGYPFFLAGLYWLFGANPNVAEIANAVLGAGTAGLVFLLGLALFDRTAARLGALILAVLPGQIFFVPPVYSETLFGFLFVAGLLLAVMATRAASGRWYFLIGFGLVAGAAALVREAGLSLPFIAFAYWGLSGGGWGRSLRWTAGVLALAGLLIFPWSVRNYLALDGPVLISSSTGMNFWQGHHEGASGGLDFPGAIEFSREHGPRSPPGAEIEISNAGLRQGLRFAATHPTDELQLVFKKLGILYRGDVVGLNISDQYGAESFLSAAARYALAKLATAAYYAAGILAAFGLVRWASQRGTAPLLPFIAVVALTLGSVVFFADPRFHFPIVPAICLLAGWGAAWLARLAGQISVARQWWLRLRPAPGPASDGTLGTTAGSS